MLKLVSVLTVLLAVCYAQERPKLAIPETFEAMFDSVMRGHGGPDHTGKGTWYRSETLQDDKRTDTVTNSTGSFTFMRLDLFTDHVEYTVEGTKCEKRTLPEEFKFPMIWMDFEDRGHFDGRREEKVGNTTVDVYVWTLEEHEDHAELWTKIPSAGMEITEPFAMARMSHLGMRAIIFTSFMGTEPTQSDFEVPAACKMATNTRPRPQHPMGH